MKQHYEKQAQKPDESENSEIEVLSEQLRKKVVEINKREEEEIKLNFELNSYKSQVESLENRINELHFIYKDQETIQQSLNENSDDKNFQDLIFNLQSQLRVKNCEVKFLEKTNSMLKKELNQEANMKLKQRISECKISTAEKSEKFQKSKSHYNLPSKMNL